MLLLLRVMHGAWIRFISADIGVDYVDEGWVFPTCCQFLFLLLLLLLNPVCELVEELTTCLLLLQYLVDVFTDG